MTGVNQDIQEPELSFFEQRRLIVGKNYERYENKFEKFDQKNGFVATWHWPCFLFGGWWFLYRRMYWWFLFNIVLSIIPYVNIVWWIFKGIRGNFLYWKYLENRVPKVKNEFLAINKGKMEPANYRSYLFAKGGPNNVAWVLLPIAIAIIGILAAIAIPNFLKYQAKSKQIEAKVNLKSLYTSESAYFQEKGFYGRNIGDISWSPPSGIGGKNNYSYHICQAGDVPIIAENARKGQGPESWNGLPNDPADTGFIAVAEGKINDGHTLDVWTIDNKGELQNVVNAVSEP